MGQKTSQPTRVMPVMLKTVSEACNLACDYCYYSDPEFQNRNHSVISDEVLETFIKEYMRESQGAAVFTWQGGEPLLAGKRFFEKVVYFQAKYAPKNTVISNNIQTNGTLIDEEWARFFKKYSFLVGVSLDGPQDCHDTHRPKLNGDGSFQDVMRGIAHLRSNEVNINVLSVINETNIQQPDKLMSFYYDNGFSHVQFLPCMDFKAQDHTTAGHYAITPEDYGTFLIKTFDHWFNDGEPVLSVRLFNSLLMKHLGFEAEICSHQETCPEHLVMESNGNAYPCDFYIHDSMLLGNVVTDSYSEILNELGNSEFNNLKKELPRLCRTCDYLHLCYGGCPRNRVDTESGGTDYFCESYKMLYKHSEQKMKRLAKNINVRM